MSAPLDSLEGGRYVLERQPVYLSQFADPARVGEFLDTPDSLAGDDRFGAFGFDDVDEYVFWAPRLCGLICAKMIFDGYGVATDRSVADLTEEAVKLGGYKLKDRFGRKVDRGWFYQPLVELAQDHGLDGDVIGDYSSEDVCRDILDGKAPVVSVHPGVIREDLDELPEGASGGHLVVVVGFTWEGGKPSEFIVHNPSGREARTQASYRAPTERFEEAFAGRGFVLWE